MLYKNVLSEWLEYKKLEIRNSSLQNYLHCINNWIIPSLGNKPTDSITSNDLQNFIIDFATNHKQNTVINITKPLSGSFKWAEANGFISASPWKNIVIPKNFSEKEIVVFSQGDIKKILASCSGYKKDIILLAYRTGMRIGEILVLKWADINFNERFLTVRRTLSGYNEITAPKTKKSCRRVDLDKLTLEMLMKKNIGEGEYVFTRKDGTIYSRQSINLPKICKIAEIEPRSFHALRHPYVKPTTKNFIFFQNLTNDCSFVFPPSCVSVQY